MFFVGLHSDGRFFSFEMPEPSGPRHCGQFPAAAFSIKKPSPVTAKAIPTMSVNAMRFTFYFPLLIRSNPYQIRLIRSYFLMAVAGASPNA
jgi:hypothetical protein